jgi:membrane-bound lytic murein transglycosylase A
VELTGGGFLRVGYAGQNGHPYYAIGKELVERGALTRQEVSMQSIRRWLVENPDEGREIMALNPSYIFFRRLSGNGPKGSLGVELTPGRSLAVDRKFLPLGAPVWLEAEAPSMLPDAADVPLSRLLVAQDTGGAIKGPVRGDVFWGPGEAGEEVAGRMKHGGRLWLLLPREVQITPLAAASP